MSEEREAQEAKVVKDLRAEIEGLKRDNAFMASNDYVESLTSEIERLKDKIRGLEKLNQMTDEEVVMELKAEIEWLKALLTRAAEALEEFHGRYYVIENCDCAVCKLTRELRKAAE